MFIFLILGLLLGGSVVIFVAQNTDAANVVFLAWHFQGSLALVIILSVAAGMAISALLYVPSTIARMLLISALKKDAQKLKDELMDKKIEVEGEKGKVAATNAYLDAIEKNKEPL